MRVTRKAQVLEKVAKLRVIGNVSPENVTALEQLGKKRKKKTYPISRYITSPVTALAGGAITGGLIGGLRGANDHRYLKRAGLPVPRGLKGALVAGGALGGAVGSGAAMWAGKALYNKLRGRALKGKANINDTSWSSKEEKQIIKSLQKK